MQARVGSGAVCTNYQRVHLFTFSSGVNTSEPKGKLFRLRAEQCGRYPHCSRSWFWDEQIGGGLDLINGLYFRPKICNWRLLATYTWPFATTGTRFALPLKLGQAPALP